MLASTRLLCGLELLVPFDGEHRHAALQMLKKLLNCNQIVTPSPAGLQRGPAPVTGDFKTSTMSQLGCSSEMLRLPHLLDLWCIFRFIASQPHRTVTYSRQGQLQFRAGLVDCADISWFASSRSHISAAKQSPRHMLLLKAGAQRMYNLGLCISFCTRHILRRIRSARVSAGSSARLWALTWQQTVEHACASRPAVCHELDLSRLATTKHSCNARCTWRCLSSRNIRHQMQHEMRCCLGLSKMWQSTQGRAALTMAEDRRLCIALNGHADCPELAEQDFVKAWLGRGLPPDLGSSLLDVGSLSFFPAIFCQRLRSTPRPSHPAEGPSAWRLLAKPEPCSHRSCRKCSSCRGYWNPRTVRHQLRPTRQAQPF